MTRRFWNYQFGSNTFSNPPTNLGMGVPPPFLACPGFRKRLAMKPLAKLPFVTELKSKCLKMSEPKKSLAEAIGSMAELGAVFAGEVQYIVNINIINK